MPTFTPTLGQSHHVTQPQITVIPAPSQSSPLQITSSLNLTYIHTKEVSAIYSIPILCMSSEEVCFGEPQIIYEFSTGGFKNVDDFIATLSKPYWSSNGNQLLTSAMGRDGRSDIYIWSVNELNWVNLTNSPVDDYDPQWSSDGVKIYFLANSQDVYGNFGNSQLYSYDLKSKEQATIPIGVGISSFSVSPDGKKIAFSSGDTNGHDQLYLTDMDGSGIQQITSSDSDNRNPSFSPDNRKITFVRSITKPSDEGMKTTSHIYVKNLDTNDEINLTETLGVEVFCPTFSPDGNWVSFHSRNTQLKSNDLFVVSVEHKELIQISQSNGYADKYIFPSWRYSEE